MLWDPNKDYSGLGREGDLTPALRETLQLEAIARWEALSACGKNKKLDHVREREGVTAPEVPTFPVKQIVRPHGRWGRSWGRSGGQGWTVPEPRHLKSAS